MESLLYIVLILGNKSTSLERIKLHDHSDYRYYHLLSLP